MLFHLDFRRSLKLVLPIAILLSFILLVAQMKDRLEWYKNRIAELPQVFLQTQSEDPLETIKQLCGELCDLSKEIQTGEFIGSVRANVNCDNIFEIEKKTAPYDGAPPSLANTSQHYKDYLLHNGLVDVKEWYFDNKDKGGGRNEPLVFSREHIDKLVQTYREKGALHPADFYYPGCTKLIEEAAEVINVTGKTVLVIGSQTPWLEAVLIHRNVSKVITLEYGWFISEHPKWELVRPHDFYQRYHEGSLEKFDAVFSYSSLEHSGLGRYGDNLNPWADIITIAQAWCVSKEDAKLVVGVPTFIHGKDRVEFNAGRVYGPRLYSYLTTNWQFIWPSEDEKRTKSNGEISYQPAFIFSKLV